MRQNVKPTQEPVPSSNIKDLFFNSGLLDIWATSLEHKYIDRFGNCHLTAVGMEWLFKELVEKFKVDMNTAIVAAGYITIDSFQKGADLPNNELTQRNHILRDETTGEYFRWDGDLPKQVLAGSTPQSTGGIGKGAWVNVGDASLRGDIKSSDGASIIGIKKPFTNSIKRTVLDCLSEEVSPFDFIGGTFTEKMQAAVDYVGSKGGGEVVIPDGEYLNTGTITISHRRVTIKGRSRLGVIIHGASGIDCIFHYKAPNSGTSYINRYLDGGDVHDLTLIGYDYGENQTDDQVVTHGIYCDGVTKSNYYNISAVNLVSVTKLNGVKDCHFYEWHDADRQPLGAKKCLRLVKCVTGANEYFLDNHFHDIHMHAKLAHFDFWDSKYQLDGCNIYNNTLFVNNTDLQFHIRAKRMIYSTITGNKFFESRGVGIHLDAPTNVTISDNLIAIPGQKQQASGILLTNNDNLTNYGKNVVITGNSINRSSGDSITVYGIDGFVIADNNSDLAGDTSYYNGQTWGSSVHIRCGAGAKNGKVNSNRCSNPEYNKKDEYSRATYEVLLESGTHNIEVDNQTPFYVQDNGISNSVLCADYLTNNSTVVNDNSARNLIRNHTRDLNGWGKLNSPSREPSVSYNSGTITPTQRSLGVSTLTFPDTTENAFSKFSCNIGTSGAGSMPAVEINDGFIFSVFMRSASNAMRKVTLEIGNSSGTFNVVQVFNVGTTWKRYWFKGSYNGATTSQFQAFIGTQNAIPAVIQCYGAKVELIKHNQYVKRETPSAYDFCKIMYRDRPTSTNGGDCQVGDVFVNIDLTATSSTGYVCVSEGANSLSFSKLPNLTQ
ncbi:right-handed parallel beta-helix repeat-containing protein [Providencia rettgeri]